MKSTIGRPRLLTDHQIKFILESHTRYLAWKALRRTLKTQRDLAIQLGVSQSTISRVVRLAGGYKQISPDLRPGARGARDG